MNHSTNHLTNLSLKNEPIIISTLKKTFRILQITDTHLFRLGIFDKRHLRKVRDLCIKWDVDLLIHTGDLFGYNGCSIHKVKQILSGMDNIVGSVVPWAFAWGNHDQCLKDKVDTPCNFDATEKHMEELPNCLYRQTREFFENYEGFESNKIKESSETRESDEIRESSEAIETKKRLFIGGNYVVSLQNSETKENLWNFFMFNTGGSDGIVPQALDWMGKIFNKNDCKNNNTNVPCLAFYHVPNFEYNTIWDTGNCKGIKNEKVCHSEDNGMMHKAFTEYGSIKGCFVGHDHINDYYGILDNIVYSYGRKNGTHGYGCKFQKVNYDPEIKKIRSGGKLISLNLDERSWSFKTVFDDGFSWNESVKFSI